MVETTKFSEAYNLWKEYYSIHVKRNKDLMKPLFHSILSVPLQDSGFYDHATKNHCRFSMGIIQNSGTGKGVALQAGYHLARTISKNHKLPNKPRYTISDTEASVIGSYDAKNNVPINGYLDKTNLYCWDEGEILMKPNPYSSDLRKYLNMALDREGRVTKGLSKTSIEYTTKATLVFTTFLSDSINTSVFKEGFFQRLFIYYKKLSPQEVKLCLKEAIEDDSGYETFQKSISLRNEISDILKPIKRHLRITKEAKQRTKEFVMGYFDKFITENFEGQKQDDMSAYFSRVPQIMYKIACHKALLQNQKEITESEIAYSEDLTLEHLKSASSLLSEAREVIINKEKTDEQRLICIIEKYSNGITQKNLFSHLKNLKSKGEWKIGKNRSGEMLRKMADDEKCSLICKILPFKEGGKIHVYFVKK